MMGIQAFFQFFITVFDLITKITYFGFIISGTIGHLIVNYSLVLFSFVYSILTTVLDVLQVLYEDYCIFLVDLINKGICIATILASFVEGFINTASSCWGITKSFCAGIHNFVMLSVETVCGATAKSAYYISCIPEVLKNFITLVGSGVWLALKVVPLVIVYTISMCVFFVGKSCEEILTLIDSLLKGMLSVITGTVQFVHDIPLEAHAGLILGIFILCAGMRYQTHLIHCFLYLIGQVKHLLHCGWTNLEMSLLSLFTNQNDEIDEEPNEIEESSDESDNSQVQNIVSDGTLSLRSRLVSRQEKPNPTKRHLLYQLEQEQESKLCVVCQDRSKCVIIFPCRHLCLCSECCVIIQQEHGTCPMCRQNVRENNESVYLKEFKFC